MEYYFLRYGDLELQRRMVSDRWRTDAFARAIAEAVRPGDVVLDVGTGTGILAMLAAKAGAKTVYGVDASEIVQSAANLVKANDLSGTVKILRGPAQELELNEPVDLIVSEWLGHLAFVENMLDDVLVARDRNLVEGGRMLPSKVDVRLAPLDDPYLYFRDGPGAWRNSVHGLDLTSLEPIELRQGRAVQTRIDPSGLLASSSSISRIDLARTSNEGPYGKTSHRFEVTRDGVLNGFAGWFVAQLSEGVVLDTGPQQPETHWSQTWFPFPPQPVRKGQILEVLVDICRDQVEKRYLSVDIRTLDLSQCFVVE
ncbi:MAG: 50S ribosomal protein L11 methyltransferase [Myxococcales bacterium]|nr:50S ribosomal protein L11 methyltransferase [Myxococcales bacterium]